MPVGRRAEPMSMPVDLSRCLFHQRTPAQATAPALVPLGTLCETDPEAYARALTKYQDTPERRRLPETRIPLLDVLWTEVVFLSPIRPHAIWRTWRDVGGIELPEQEFWAIPAEDVRRPVVLERHLSTTGEPIDPREVREFDTAMYRSEGRSTLANEDWVRHLRSQGRRGAWFHGTPHVLTSEPVDLARARVIGWSTA